MFKLQFPRTPAIVFLLALVAMQAKASEPVNFSLTPDIAIHNKSTHIKGFILNIWGENPQTAFALGLVNGSTGASSGVSLGFLANYTQSYTGAHLGLVNYASGNFKGLQWGAVNYAKSFKGLQLGIVNYAENMTKGFQIGLINIIGSNKHFFSEFPQALAPLFVVFNWRL